MPLPGRPLRLAVLADFEGPHARRWLRVFVERGHEMHAISYYRPRAVLAGVQLHVLSGGGTAATSTDEAAGPGSGARGLKALIPPSPARFIHAWRYRRAGLQRTVRAIAPDVFHAHYAVEHGFYGAFAGFHPYIVSAWGSDLLVESHKALGRLAARYALGQADLVTANDPSLVQRAVELGVAPERVQVVRLGIDEVFFETPPPDPLPASGEGGSESEAGAEDDALTVISDRALEPLYNVDVVLRAFARLRPELPGARLLVAHDGGERARLEALAGSLGLGETVRFLGRLAPSELAAALRRSQVYVSVPRSDSFALSNLEALACGCFPVLSDLPSVRDLIEDGVNGLLVRPGDVEGLAAALRRALTDAALRQDAVARNRALAEAEGSLERNMLLMERLYYRLAGLPLNGTTI